MSLINSFNSKNERLIDRSFMLQRARSFFYSKGLIEVDCPLLTLEASVDAHIDLIPATYQNQQIRYLHSSPEYGMKRLLANGIPDCFQLAHVFRDGELSHKHNPEFMMAEWYRLGFSIEAMIDETLEFIQLFLGALPSKIVSYRTLFLEHTGIDYHTADKDTLFNFILKNDIPYYATLKSEDKDALLNLILGSLIEPKLGHDELFVLAFYPSTQAALAQKRFHGEEAVAERFEVYYQGVELANGYHELVDAQEQKFRLEESNQHRIQLGKAPLPIDTKFLHALKKGLPDCSGVAVGVDRLMMLRQKQSDIAEVIPFGWETA